MTALPVITVLTGDIVASSELGPDRLDAAMQALAEASDDVALWQGAPTRFTRARGDGWQMVLARPGLTLRAAMRLRAGLRRRGRDLATRIGIAIGAGEVPPLGDLNAAGGPAFTASGRALDGMRAPHQIALADGPAGLAAALVLADHLSQGWTEAQARSLVPALSPDAPTRAEIGAALGISRQAVDQALDAAALWAIEAACRELEGDA